MYNRSDTFNSYVSYHTRSIISNNLDASNVVVVPPVGNSDHNQVSIEIPLIKVHKPSAYHRLIWQYDKANWAGLNDALLNYNWDSCFTDDDVNNCATKWTETFINFSRTFIPNKLVLIRPWDNPWFTAALRRLRRRRDRLYKLAKRSNKPNVWELYRQARNVYVQEIKEAKVNYELLQVNKINNSISSSSRSWWQTVKGFFDFKSKRTSIPAVQLPNGTVTNDPLCKADLFNSFFISNSQLDTSNATLPPTHYETDVRLCNIKCSDDEVRDI